MVLVLVSRVKSSCNAEAKDAEAEDRSDDQCRVVAGAGRLGSPSRSVAVRLGGVLG